MTVTTQHIEIHENEIYWLFLDKDSIIDVNKLLCAYLNVQRSNF